MADRSSLGYTAAYRDPVGGGYPLGNGYRGYLPHLMRFGAPDSRSPFGRGGLNCYAYCAGDPANRRDPSGHMNVPGEIMEDVERSLAHPAEEIRARDEPAAREEPAAMDVPIAAEQARAAAAVEADRPGPSRRTARPARASAARRDEWGPAFDTHWSGKYGAHEGRVASALADLRETVVTLEDDLYDLEDQLVVHSIDPRRKDVRTAYDRVRFALRVAKMKEATLPAISMGLPGIRRIYLGNRRAELGERLTGLDRLLTKLADRYFAAAPAEEGPSALRDALMADDDE
ncbi:RHS repeat-associated core domain-containing protein [Bordetella bronchialis]|uniref:RHS repeat-associated core domain-containing protein n=2 Tax=Bordetella bronchialis TaxID=463025 RepID=A0ABM6CPS7_9BORD|nr:hypothetical protein BAU06_06045 [Bordetella bronchialis]